CALLQEGSRSGKGAPGRLKSSAVLPRCGSVELPEGVGARDQDRRRREGTIGTLIIHEGQAELLEVVGALGAARGLARRLDGREQQGDQDGDDGDDDQQLDQRETTPGHPARTGMGHRRILSVFVAGGEEDAEAWLVSRPFQSRGPSRKVYFS